MSNTALLIVLDFPPSNTSSIQRVVKFYEHLKENDWNVVVLTADSRVYRNINSDVSNFNIDWEQVYRAKAFDASVDFAIKGKCGIFYS